MKPSRAFWGTFFVVLGVLLIAGRAYDFDFGFSHVWRFWPVALVLIGLAIIFKSPRTKWILAAAAALVAAFFLYGLINFGWPRWDRETVVDNDDTRVQEFSEPFSSGIKRASFTMDAAAGRFNIDTTSDRLLYAKVRSDTGPYTLERTSSEDNVDLRLKSEGHMHVRHWGFSRPMNIVDVRLNVTPVWDMKFNIGAADVDLDVSMLKVERVRMDAGAASIQLRLGVPVDETHVRIHAGASSIKLSIPESVGCEVIMGGALSSKHLDDFEKTGSHTYRTENFDNTTKRIFVDAETGVSSVRVVRY